MAVSDEFRESWLECQEEYGKNIESGDIPVLELDRIDESISLPAVKFTAPFNPNIDNQFDSYVHVPMATFKKPIDDLADQVSQATSDLVEVKRATVQATADAIAATDEASNVDADLTGMTVTITNRKGVSKEVNIGFEILARNVYPSIAAMNANAAYVRAGEFCMIATTDPTSPENAQLWSRNSSPSTSEHPFTFLSDLDQAATSAFADWLENYKPVIEADHTRAENDHTRSENDHIQALRDHEVSEQATLAANTQANRAKGYNDHPWTIGDDGYIYVWNEATKQMVRTEKMIIDFSDLTPEQQAAMVQEFLSHLTFDETPTEGSSNPVTSRGIKTALDQKQDTLTFATDALCVTAAAEIIFTPSD